MQNFAMITGHHLAEFSCNELSDKSSISRLIQGAAMDGCWTFFGDVHRLQRQALKALVSCVQMVMDSLTAKFTHCLFYTGCQVSIRKFLELLNCIASEPLCRKREYSVVCNCVLLGS